MLKFDRLTPEFGALVDSAVQVAQLDAGQFDALVQIWQRHHVLVLRDQQLTDAQFEAFSARLGELDPPPNQGAGRKNVPGFPNLYVVSNVKDAKGEPIGALGDGEAQWHTDMSYLAAPPMASMLWSREIPTSGGDTCFASMTAALRAMPPHLQQRLHTLCIKHDGTYDSGGTVRKGVTPNDDPMQSVGTLHPAVIAHPDTGEPSLYLGRRRNAFIPALGGDARQAVQASDALLDEIWHHATAADRTLRHRWRVGDVVLWNNFTTMHRRDAFPPDQRRVMHRSQIKGPGAPAASRPWRQPAAEVHA
jgi:taurine dioxygenase